MPTASAPVRALKVLLLIALAVILLGACDSQDASQSAVGESAHPTAENQSVSQAATQSVAAQTITAPASAAGETPEVAQAAVNETCAALTHLQQEWRLGRVGDDQWHTAYNDILTSLVAAGERIGRPLGPDVSARCPNAWHDTNEVFEELRAENEATLVELHCQLLIVIRPVVGYADLNYAKEYDDLRSKLGALALTEAVAEHCPAVWEDGVVRRDSVSEETADKRGPAELRERPPEEGQTPSPTPARRPESTPSAVVGAASTPIPTSASGTDQSQALGSSDSTPGADDRAFEEQDNVDRDVLLIERVGDVALLNTKTSELRPLADFLDLPDAPIGESYLSRDTSKLAITFGIVSENRIYNGESIYIMDLIEPKETNFKLDLLGCVVYDFEWSIDGRKAMFTSTHIGGHVPTCENPSAYVLDIEQQSVLAEVSGLGYEALSEDGSRILGWEPMRESPLDRTPISKSNILLYDVIGETVQRFPLVVDEHDQADALTGFQSLAIEWSPDRSRVAVYGMKDASASGPRSRPVKSYDDKGQEFTYYVEYGIFIISMQNGHWKIKPSWIPVDGGISRHLHWSSDGLYVALLGRRHDDTRGWGDIDAFVIHTQDGSVTQLSSMVGEFRDFSNLTWVPKGSVIAVVASSSNLHGEDRHLVLTDVSSGEIVDYSFESGIETSGNIGFSWDMSRIAVAGCIAPCHQTNRNAVRIVNRADGQYDEFLTYHLRSTSFAQVQWLGMKHPD